MALPLKDNLSFPVVDGGFCEAIRNNDEPFQNLSVNQVGLCAILATVPVAAAEMFRIMVMNVFCTVMGIPPSASTKKKSVVLPERPTIVFGVPVAAFGCTEEQARRSLRMHIVFSVGIPPNLLQAAGGIDFLKTAISQAIDAVACGELEPLTHFRHLIRDLQGKTPPHACLYKPHHLIREKKTVSKRCSASSGSF
jgi:hypothetical protein